MNEAIIVSWENHKIRLDSKGDLPTLIQQVNAEAIKENIPIALEVGIGSKVMMITIGDQRSMVSYSPHELHFDYVLSGTEVDPAFAYLFHGSYSEVDNNCTVAADEAIEAMYEFVKNHERPSKLPWKD